MATKPRKTRQQSEFSIEFGKLRKRLYMYGGIADLNTVLTLIKKFQTEVEAEIRGGLNFDD